MKVRVNLKDPDGVYLSIVEAGLYTELKLGGPHMDVIKNFIKYDEYVSIEIDTETGEARVLNVQE